MIIMFIFLGLTIVFIIGTAIYLNKSKKQNGFTQNIDKKENQGKKVDKKKLENIFNFKIKDNMICIGNRYSNIIRLGNIVIICFLFLTGFYWKYFNTNITFNRLSRFNFLAQLNT